MIALAGCDAIRDYQRRTLYQPDRTRPHEQVVERIDGLERWWLPIDEGRVEAWFLPAIGTNERAPVVVFAHGNAELIEDWAELLRPYREMGLHVLLPEYRSYGRSAGTPSEASIVRDYAQFYDRLVDRPDVDATRIVFHGRSLGGGVVGALLEQRQAQALVLESTFTNVPDLASRWLAPSGFIADRFDTRAMLARASLPTLILHGVDDELVPFKHARELQRVAWDGRLVAYRAGHNDLPRTEAAYWSRVRAFLVEAGVLAVLVNPG